MSAGFSFPASICVKRISSLWYCLLQFNMFPISSLYCRTVQNCFNRQSTLGGKSIFFSLEGDGNHTLCVCVYETRVDGTLTSFFLLGLGGTDIRWHMKGGTFFTKCVCIHKTSVGGTWAPYLQGLCGVHTLCL